MTNLTERIVNKLKDRGIKIYHQYDKDGIDFVCTEMMIVYCDKKMKTARLLFHVASRSDDSAQVVLDLNGVKGLKNLYIDDLFIYVDDYSEVVIGKEAVKLFENDVKHNIIEEFTNEQKQLHFLATCQDIPMC